MTHWRNDFVSKSRQRCHFLISFAFFFFHFLWLLWMMVFCNVLWPFFVVSSDSRFITNTMCVILRKRKYCSYHHFSFSFLKYIVVNGMLLWISYCSLIFLNLYPILAKASRWWRSTNYWWELLHRAGVWFTTNRWLGYWYWSFGDDLNG